jgi:hypothetical protein
MLKKANSEEASLIRIEQAKPSGVKRRKGTKNLPVFLDPRRGPAMPISPTLYIEAGTHLVVW